MAAEAIVVDTVPRFTATLRANVLPTPSSQISTDELYVGRAAALEAWAAKPPSQQHLLGREPLAAPRAVRDKYYELARVVSSMVGTDVSEDALAQYVVDLFRAVLKNASQDLAKSLGFMPSPDQMERLLMPCASLRSVSDHCKWPLHFERLTTREEWRPTTVKISTDPPLDPNSAFMLLCHPPNSSPPPEPADVPDSFHLRPHAPHAFLASGGSASATETTARLLQPDEPDSDEEVMQRRRPTVSLTWLERTVCSVTEHQPPSKGGDDTILMMVVRLLMEQPNSELAAGELLDVLGIQHLETVSKIFSNRAPLVESLQKAVATLRAMEAVGQDSAALSHTVRVNTASQKALKKMERKAAKKSKGKQAGIISDLDYATAMGWAALQETEEDNSNTLDLGGGVEIAIGDNSRARKALPPGTKREVYKGYEEVSVPAINAADYLQPIELVTIDSLPEWAREAFQGYTTLNRIQSTIFQTGFFSNENMLVCAPTGAGKTNIAMITVLREVSLHLLNGDIQLHKFKIVYVAPMKALAAEVTRNFQGRLSRLGMQVRELTGDMQLSKNELESTQMIVTTPEKWDVITRKGGDVAMAALVRLLIIDEVHLLNDDRGPVIETIVARTLRQVETSQQMIRIVGLSATLPNHQDVAQFLGVSKRGLFFFGPEYRPVPLQMAFVGVTEKNLIKRNLQMNEIAYLKLVASLRDGHQGMVFVHSRKDTAKTAEQLVQLASVAGELELFAPDPSHPHSELVKKEVGRSNNHQVQELFKSGFGIHHAGMLRSDRNMVERLFSEGHLKVLVCTATLAWGVNLPARTVIIKGTQVYNSERGCFTDLGVLDVQQIFGRAGRPQFDSLGDGNIITTHEKLPRYLAMLTNSTPIESQFVKRLSDNLNAEVVLGTVSSIAEAQQWLSYTYLHVRMVKNPLPYGITMQDLTSDPSLDLYRRLLVTNAAKTLEACKMVRYDARSGNLYMTDLGRVASHYYIKHESISTINATLHAGMSEHELLHLIAKCAEFEGMRVREDEMTELEQMKDGLCRFPVHDSLVHREGKVQVLAQVYISRGSVDSFSLVADMHYVADNAPRIARALFEIALKNSWADLVSMTLTVCKMFERRLWPRAHALWQLPTLEPHYVAKLEKADLSVDRLNDMSDSEIGSLLRMPTGGVKVKKALEYLPQLSVSCEAKPITRSVLFMKLTVTPHFKWNDRLHGSTLRWLLLVSDSGTDVIYHHELWLLTKKMMSEDKHFINFTIPVFEPLSSQYFVTLEAFDWMECSAGAELNLQSIVLPSTTAPHTDLLDLDPLPRSVLKYPAFEKLYEHKFTHFNPIQTQAFHTLYHSDKSVLLGAPTGSGKTVSCELAILRVFLHYPNDKILYIAPLKALVRERIKDWGKGLCKHLGKSLVELTGDYTPDLAALLAADIIICTPEKWDGISRNWKARGYVRMVRLVIMDEIHLLGSDRGPILEVIVSRMRNIAEQTERPVRFVGLSTALANAHDLASWLGITAEGLFNFRPAVRPVQLEAHIQGFPGKFYCPRMATMNKPAYAAIVTHSEQKPVLIFVSSRRQTRLTALDLVAFAAADMKPSQWMHMMDFELNEVLERTRDPTLRHLLQFGIGLHHAGLDNQDKDLVERLFCEQKIQILVATSTLAWGVNTPAHLVIIKGTEYYDAPSKRYVDYPITDVLQMMGRAGRPQFDRTAKAVIMVHEPKKGYYKKFLYEPFPVESSLPGQLTNHLNAEIANGTVRSLQDAVNWLTWTYFYRRLPQNPGYYGLEGTEKEQIAQHLSDTVQNCLADLKDAGCIEVYADNSVEPQPAGHIAALYYLHFETIDALQNMMEARMNFKGLLSTVSAAAEYDELPVRHNEDKLNAQLSRSVRWPVSEELCDDPHVKANLLLQAHMGLATLPISDYVTDTRSVLDNSMRLLQAMVDFAADQGWLATTMGVIRVMQAVIQGQWPDKPTLNCLPHIRESAATLEQLEQRGVGSLSSVLSMAVKESRQLQAALATALTEDGVKECMEVVQRLPAVHADCSFVKRDGGRGPQPSGCADEDGSSNGAAPAEDEDDGGSRAAGVQQPATLKVTLRRRGWPPSARKRGRDSQAVYAPRFPKIKEEAWFLVAGNPDVDELLALRRVRLPAGRVQSANLQIPYVSVSRERHSRVVVFIMSDSYLGLDQHATVQLDSSSVVRFDYVVEDMVELG